MTMRLIDSEARIDFVPLIKQRKCSEPSETGVELAIVSDRKWSVNSSADRGSLNLLAW